MQEAFNEKSSLQLIESMINKARNNFSESGTLYLLWGFVVLICSLFQFTAIQVFQYDKSHYIWFLTWLVVIYQLVFLSRKRKNETARTYTADIIKFVWLCFGVSMFLFIFILIKQQAYQSINPAILVMYGMPTFLSGIILKFRPLVIGGILCWALSAGSVLVPYNFQILFISAAVLVGWIIPGFLLRKKYLNQQ